jgi:hypothetical protein
MAIKDDRARLDLERKAFEAYAEPKGYNLERVKADKYDAFKSAYKNDAVDHEWHGWKARANLQVELMKASPVPPENAP